MPKNYKRFYFSIFDRVFMTFSGFLERGSVEQLDDITLSWNRKIAFSLLHFTKIYTNFSIH